MRGPGGSTRGTFTGSVAEASDGTGRIFGRMSRVSALGYRRTSQESKEGRGTDSEITGDTLAWTGLNPRAPEQQSQLMWIGWDQRGAIAYFSGTCVTDIPGIRARHFMSCIAQ